MVLAARLFLSLKFGSVTTPVLVKRATSSQSLDPPRTEECDSAVLVYMKQCLVLSEILMERLGGKGWVGRYQEELQAKQASSTRRLTTRQIP